MFDFIPVVPDGLLVAMYPTPPEYDLELFIRPYSKDSWWMVGLTTLVLLVLYYVPQFFPIVQKHRSELQSVRMVQSIGWYFFMLLEVYYSGALTMFFSTEIGVPFETMKEAMQAYPEWKMQLQRGMEVFFVYKVQEKDPDYLAFWDRVENMPEETVFQEWDEGIRRMREDYAVILFEEGRLKGYMMDHPEALEGLGVFDKQKKEFYNLIVTQNSPLGPVLKYGAVHIYEKGLVNYIYKSYLGGELGQGGGSMDQDSMVLRPQQLVLIFFIVLSVMGGVVVLFLLETVWSGINRHVPLEEMATAAVERIGEEADMKTKRVWSMTTSAAGRAGEGALNKIKKESTAQAAQP